MELEAKNWRLCSATLVRGVAVELEDEKWRLGNCFLTLGIFYVHSSQVFSVRFPTPAHAASPLTSSSHAHDDELGCHRLATGWGFGRPARYFVHLL